MATFVSNLTNGQIDEKGFLRLVGSLLSQSGVIQPGSLAVSAQVTPDMSVQVAGGLTGHGVVFITSSGDTYHGWNTDNLNVTIATNSSGVTKTDAIVVYPDLTGGIATSNNPGALKFVAVRRSGANTGAPTSAEISTAVSGNPYVVLAPVTVANGVSSINSGNVVDQRTFAQLTNIADGIVTPAKRTFSGALAKQSTDLSIPNNAFTSVTFNTNEYDTASYHSTGSNTSRITVPATGYYRVGYSVSFAANATGIRRGRMSVNGNGEYYSHEDKLGASSIGITVSGERIFSLSAGNYLEVQVFQNSGPALNISGESLATGFTHFFIERLS